MPTSTTKACPARARRGFGLIEGLIASTILAAAMVGIGVALLATVQQSRGASDDTTAVLLARQLMEEIASKPLLDPDTSLAIDQEGSRSLYDNVGDYHGYTDATTALATSDGTTVRSSADAVYRRSVTVVFRASPAGADLATGPFALATVRVTSPQGRVTELTRLVSRTTIDQEP